jgi:predicted GNAT family acetyltransferase
MSREVRENVDRSRFEITLDGEVAGFTSYRRVDAETVTLVHTEIDPAYEGQGLGSLLVGRTLDELRRRDIAVLPSCPFVREYIGNHAEYLDLVPAAERARYRLAPSRERDVRE